MFLLLLICALVFLLTFAIVAAATAPPRDAKILDKRIAAIAAAAHGGSGDVPLEAAQLLRKTAEGQFAWVETALVDYAPMQKFRRFVSQSGVNTNAASILFQTLFAAALGYVVVSYFTHVFVLALAAACLLGILPFGRIAFMRMRRVRSFEDSLAHAIDMMARALRAGHSIASSFEIVAQGSPQPAAGEFAEVFRQQNFGLPLRDALLQMLDRVPSQDLRVVITGIIVQRETGGNLVEILDRTVFVIRERQRIRGEIRTQTAQGRLTGWILTMLPVAMLLLINLLDPGYSKVLLDDPLGQKMMYTGLGMIAIGAFIMNRIMNSIDV